MDLVVDQVLSPWTEVMAQVTQEGIDVDVWGRTYGFVNAPLPTSIVTGCEEILASPVRLVGILDGKPLSWERKGIFIFRNTKSQATLSGWQANSSLIVNATVWVEFDGLVWIDMVVMPQSGVSPKLDELWLEVPLKPDRAALFHYWPGRWGSAENSGAVPENGLALPFRPFVWLGWEEGGLSWFTESDKGWQLKDASRCIEVLRKDEEMVLRIHILDSQPQRLPLAFTFGFQATPVKPFPKDFHKWQICHGASYGIDRQVLKEGESTTVLDRMAELGVKTLVFHEHWTPIQNYWETTHEAELKQLVSECHKRGIKLLLYFGYELSTLAPEWGELADDVLVKGTQGDLAGGYYRHPEQRDYIVCYNNRWQDYLADGIAWALERYGFDGVYLDGTIEPWGCANERHGCGYRASDGSLRVTYPIFAVRNLMRRLYTLIHPKGGLVNAHQSTCCVTPTLSFCHSYWDGEQFGGGELAGDPLRKLPLASFRAEFMGRNFGVPCEFLVYEKPPEWTFEHALAFTLLHDVRVRPGGFGRPLDLMSEIWKAMNDFDVSKAEWYPYWRNQQFVRSQPESVKVSFYLSGNEALFAISNLSADQHAEAQITLDSNAMGVSEAFSSAYDALSGESLPLNDNCLRLSIQPMRLKLVRVK